MLTGIYRGPVRQLSSDFTDVTEVEWSHKFILCNSRSRYHAQFSQDCTVLPFSSLQMSYADDWWVRVRSYEFCTKATACDCDACVRLKKAAQQIDDLTWWTDDDAADAIARAQLAIAEARETLHELHAADRRSVMRYGRHLEDVPRGELYIRSEKDDHEEFGEDYESVEEVSGSYILRY